MSPARSRSGGSADRDHVDAVVQLLAELALGHRLAQVAVGGRHQAHVDVDQRGAADAADLPLLEHPQQLRLEGQRELADLVQEQRAADRPPRIRPGSAWTAPVNAPFSWPNSSDSSSCSGSEAQSTGHERLGGARAVGVDGARDQLLAGARLAQDEDVRLRARRLPDQLEDPRHGRARAR